MQVTWLVILLSRDRKVVHRKKRGRDVCVWRFYGRFLSIRTMSMAPIMIMMIAITAIPNSRLDVDARPVGGAAVGAGVGAAALSVKVDSADDG